MYDMEGIHNELLSSKHTLEAKRLVRPSLVLHAMT